MRSKALMLGLLACAACAERPERLQVNDRTVILFNDSRREWRSVEIWLNDHYRVTRDRMAPGERFTVPLDVFVAGFGQRFARNQQVRGIEVTATDSAGEPVRLVYGERRRR
jgi:hypothetical protein